MFENWFTNKCEALVDARGRALTGTALDAAEKILSMAKQSGCKVWIDNAGNYYMKENKFFSRATQILDENGQPLHTCGHLVKTRAKFCSKCGAPAPGGWWRCGGCGAHIGNESKTCPHCGRPQNISHRLDMANGKWIKDEEVFAESFDLGEFTEVMGDGLEVQENQYALLLDGGRIIDEYKSGFHKMADLKRVAQGARSIVMIDTADFDLPLCVDQIRASDDLESELHMILTLKFDETHSCEFMQNLMHSGTSTEKERVTSALSYEEVAHSILQNADVAVRDFCNKETTSTLFSDADVRIRLEDYIAKNMQEILTENGLKFVRLKKVEFESEVFDRLRQSSGKVEEMRREIEFIRRAEDLVNDAARRKAMSEADMEDYMKQLAHEKGIKDELRDQELENMRNAWKRDQEIGEMKHRNAISDMEREHGYSVEVSEAEHKEDIINVHFNAELKRKIDEQRNSLEFKKIDAQIQEIEIEIKKKKDQAENERLNGLVDLYDKYIKSRRIDNSENKGGANGICANSSLSTENKLENQKEILPFVDQILNSKITPELMLAAAFARGNTYVMEALERMTEKERDVITRSQNENREIYEKLLQMSERMFNQLAAFMWISATMYKVSNKE